MLPRVAIVLSSFNRVELLRDALSSIGPLLQSRYAEFTLVVFDAGSTDGSLRVIGEFFAAVPPASAHLIVGGADDDSSFASGLNRACSYASTHHHADYFFLFETDNQLLDAAPVPRALRLLQTIPNIAAAGFTVRRRDGRSAGFGCRAPTILSFVAGQQLSAALSLHEPRVEWIEGDEAIGRYAYCDIVYTSPLLVRAAAWNQILGMCATEFPFSDSDLDLCLRFRSADWRCAVLQDERVVHDNLGQASAWSATRTIRFHQARFRLLRKHVGPRVYAAIPLLFLRHLAEWCVLVARPGARRSGKPRTRQRLMRMVLTGYD